MAYSERFSVIKDELEWLYMELYEDRDMLHKLEATMEEMAISRKADLQTLDERRLRNPRWFLDSSMVAETMYTELFNGTFNGIAENLMSIQHDNDSVAILNIHSESCDVGQ